MVKCPPQQSVVKSGKNNKYRNEDLPHGCQDENQWRKHFIPTFLWYVGVTSHGSKILGPWMKPTPRWPYNKSGINCMPALYRTL